jgi:MarR family transcriptional regulator for hemolysin
MPREPRLDETLSHWAARFSWAARGAGERRLKAHGLTPPMMAALLAVSGGCEKAADLAALMGVDAAAVTRLLDRLAGAGWLERGEMAGDRRCRLLHLSKKARALVPKLQAAAAEIERDLTQLLKPAEKDLLIRQLKALTEKAEKL